MILRIAYMRSKNSMITSNKNILPFFLKLTKKLQCTCMFIIELQLWIRKSWPTRLGRPKWCLQILLVGSCSCFCLNSICTANPPPLSTQNSKISNIYIKKTDSNQINHNISLLEINRVKIISGSHQNQPAINDHSGSGAQNPFLHALEAKYFFICLLKKSNFCITMAGQFPDYRGILAQRCLAISVQNTDT